MPLARDVLALQELGAIEIRRTGENKWSVSVRLDWPSRITESAFFEKIKNMPKVRTHGFLT